MHDSAGERESPMRRGAKFSVAYRSAMLLL